MIDSIKRLWTKPATPPPAAPTWDNLHQSIKDMAGLPHYKVAAGILDTVIDKLVRPFHKTVSWGDRLLTIDKAIGVKDEPGFQKVLEEIRGTHEYDQYASPDWITWRLNTLLWGARTALRLDGDFVECGVFKGDMAYTIINCVYLDKLPRTFYLYDSFAGLSPKYSSPADFPFNPGFYEYCNKHYQAEGLYENVCQRFARYSNVKIIKGYLPDTLASESPAKIAFLHIDLNSPAAEIGCLNVLWERVVPGGVVIFDDYGWRDYAPQKEAEDAWFAARGYWILELPTGQGLVVKRT